MKFAIAAVYDNYIEANIAIGLLESENIKCWLRDENIVAVDPGSTYAIGGIKLMVTEVQLERALDILKAAREPQSAQKICPECGSKKISQITTPRKTSGVLAAIAKVLLSAGASTAEDSISQCADCGNKFE